MIARCLAVGTLVAALALVSAAAAQQPPPDLRPRIGQISDEVALQRLLLRREGTEIIAQGNFRGRPATLRLDSLRGRLVDTAGSIGGDRRPLP